MDKLAVRVLDAKQALRLFDVANALANEDLVVQEHLSADCYKRCTFIRRVQDMELTGGVEVLLYDFEVWSNGDRRDGLAALLRDVADINPTDSLIAIQFSEMAYQWLYLVLEYSVLHCWTFFARVLETPISISVNHDDLFALHGGKDALRKYIDSGLQEFFGD